jgi:hypothetical protein
MSGYDDRTATMAEADAEYAANAGANRPDVAWILSDRDVWYRNPAYVGPPVPHPEDYRDDQDQSVTVMVGETAFCFIQKGEACPQDFAGAVYIKGKCAIFTDVSGTPRVALINNESTLREGPFFVSCSALPNGALRYLHGTTTADEDFVGIAGLGYAAEKDVALKVSQFLGLHPKGKASRENA